MLAIRPVFGSLITAGSSEALSAMPILGKVNICLAANLGAPFLVGMGLQPLLPHATSISISIISTSGVVTLVLQYIHIRPISEEEARTIQRHSMYPRWNNGSHCLMIEREPANSLNSYLLRLVIQLDTHITRRFFSLRDRLIKCRVAPVTVVIGSRGE